MNTNPEPHWGPLTPEEPSGHGWVGWLAILAVPVAAAAFALVVLR
jgi:hypothetical protein